MHIKEFDTVLLKDGRKAAVVEILDDTHFLVVIRAIYEALDAKAAFF